MAQPTVNQNFNKSLGNGKPNKGDAEFETFVNTYSLSQSNIMVGQGPLAQDAEPNPATGIMDKKLINDYSYSKVGGAQFSKGLTDNINEYSLSKSGKGLQ